MIINEIRSEFKKNSDPKTKSRGLKFFNKEVRICGVKTAIAHKISQAHFHKIKDRPKAEIFDICEELWRSGYLEESFVARSLILQHGTLTIAPINLISIFRLGGPGITRQSLVRCFLPVRFSP